MPWIGLSNVITAQEPNDGTGTDKSDWLNITQDNIDPRFNIADQNFISTLAATVFSGGDPYSLLTYNCPVTRRITADGVVASYRAEVIVNRSSSLEGKYTLTAGNGQYDVTGPRSATKPKTGNLLTDGKKVIELGWLPLSLSVSQAYPASTPLAWEQKNGYLYLDRGEYAILSLNGLATVDIWTVLVEHQQGESFPDSSIPVRAIWGADNRVDSEILVPGCVNEAFNECPKNILGVGGVDPEGKKWTDIQLNPCPPRIAYKDGCTGKIIRYDYQDDER